jgi:galactose-1-phosphate uridylyltransferase
MWNCLWKAAASIIHGHAQMTVGRKFHYGRIERLRRDALAYQHEHGADYFADFVAIHESLGLAARWGSVAAVAHLTPAKEREIVLVADRYENPDLPAAIWRALKVYAAQDVKSYNMAVYLPPLGPTDPAWAGFPVLVHFVDRGDLAAKTVDVGGMEFYASAVVSADPFALAEELRKQGA